MSLKDFTIHSFSFKIVGKVCNLQEFFIFKYEYFYVAYCLYVDFDSSGEGWISKQDFENSQKWEISLLAIEQIFEQIPRRFKHNIYDVDEINRLSIGDYTVLEEPKEAIDNVEFANCMGFEDFVWFLISFHDRLNDQSIKYWLKVLDLDGDGLLSLWEMERFYRVIHQKRDILQLETFEFSSIVCLIRDMFDSDSPCFSIEDLLKFPEAGAMLTAIFTDHFRFSEFVDRKTFVLPKELEFSNWVKFIEYEYSDLTRGKEEEEEFKDGFDLQEEEFGGQEEYEMGEQEQEQEQGFNRFQMTG